ncbi:hypothetical protein KIN20_016655 [Parelaphostrongylus tenuis]|uniref:Uncharacterized protein n=1 Tax=Parelaphostrongylus tenuis TaxID=148309 RepID=A0AAD5MHN1_PARTN|nr:hypothetical protein KIN20_016655 [Parelaphostrongylus tenuis]
MVYSEDAAVRARVPDIKPSKDAATGFVSRLVMQTVLDILEQQGSSALLPDSIISSILDQLRVQITYEPLECKAVTIDADVKNAIRPDNGKPHCTIIGSAVTGTCTRTQAKVMCMIGVQNQEIEPISVNHTTISGTLTTTNVIMANWSRQMWQNILNRALRMVALNPSATHFIKALATIN